MLIVLFDTSCAVCMSDVLSFEYQALTYTYNSFYLLNNNIHRAYNPKRAKDQNITVGVSFGARRELAFLHATPQQNGDKCKIYFPQTNNGVFSFGRDVNIQWKHGVNALSEEEQDGKGRISIVLWGLAENVIEEEGSPPLLGADGQGPHAQQKRDGHRGNRRRCNNNHHRGRR